MSAATKKRGPGRPPKAADGAHADVTVHVRFTAAEIDALDAHLEGLRRALTFGAMVTRTSLVRALVLTEIGLAADAGRPGRETSELGIAAQPAAAKTKTKPAKGRK